MGYDLVVITWGSTNIVFVLPAFKKVGGLATVFPEKRRFFRRSMNFLISDDDCLTAAG